MEVDRYICRAARDAIAAAVAEADGNEVFFVGRLGGDGRVEEVEVHCRGSAEAVPALMRVPRAGEAVLHNHPSGHLHPSEADLTLASRYGQDGVGFYIVDSAADAIYVVVEPHRVTQQPLDGDAIAARFGPDGELATLLPAFEHRPSQVAMAHRVVEVINDAGIALLEAGTGTGKSLAYLVPLVEHARANRVRVAVSTASINLQQQLVTKDIPVVQQLCGPVEVALVKGRGNYLCRRKLETLLTRSGELSEEEAAFARDMAAWASRTADGSLSDLPSVPPGDLWELVRSDTDQSLRSRCPHFQECFYYRSRRAAAAADLLVVNHHLLLVDLNLKHALGDVGVLPSYEAAVLDEGHHLEDVATDQLATSATTVGIERLLGRLVPKSARRTGLLGRLKRRLPRDEDGAAVQQRIRGGLEPAVAAMRDAMPAITEGVVRLVERRGGNDEGERCWRFPQQLDAIPPEMKQIVDLVEALAGLLSSVSSELGRVRRLLECLSPRWLEDEVQLQFDLRSNHSRISSTIRALAAVLEDDDATCRWIELARGQDRVARPRYLACPIDVAPLIRERILDVIPAVALTSATLTVGRRFDYLCSRIGLEPGTLAHERTVAERLESPFDFDRQVLLIVPRGFPDPRERGFTAAAEELICQVVEAARGRTFVLFTSYRMLRAVHAAASQRLEGYRLLAQGTMERSRLLEEFRGGQRAVLFGTDSFWEGVDVPGDALSCVVLARLPFRVPSHPVQQARAEAIEARGGDAFGEFALPQAVIRFRQGFGRLIRSHADRGAVVVLDSRMITRRYGRVFVQSLPQVTPRELAPAEIADRVRAFLSSAPR
jgi:ATP-dependent DNA helicase DinG